MQNGMNYETMIGSFPQLTTVFLSMHKGLDLQGTDVGEAHYNPPVPPKLNSLQTYPIRSARLCLFLTAALGGK